MNGKKNCLDYFFFLLTFRVKVWFGLRHRNYYLQVNITFVHNMYVRKDLKLQ